MVQRFPSLQSLAVIETQAPAWQKSLRVQGFPSSQLALLAACWQVPVASHESSVQGFPSSQSMAPPGTHAPLTQASFTVQAFPSSHAPAMF